MTVLAMTAMDMRHAASPNHDERPPGLPIDMLVLHYTGMHSAADAILRLRDPAARVSAHYVVEEDGLIWQLVPEQRRAWHAGVSHWRGHTGLNDRAVGIEIVNPGHEHGYRPFPALQMAAVCELCLDVLRRHPIPARNVVAHSDVAPERKQDPGELFDWRSLAANGVGLWPDADADPVSPEADADPVNPEADADPVNPEADADPVNPEADADPVNPEADADPVNNVADALSTIGYRTDLPEAVVLRAFQRHWRPVRVDGVADLGTRRRLAAVAAAVGRRQPRADS